MLNPMTTGGDLIYGGASGVPTRLANGTVGKVLTSGGTTVPPTWETPAVGSVTSVSVTTANGVSGSVATATTTPAITLTLGAITPSSVAASGAMSDSKGDVRLIPQNSQSAAYTTVIGDAGKHLLHPAADTNARTFTIDSNANVPYTIGTALTFVNETANVLSIAITADTLTLAGTTTSGTRSLAQNGVATALKVTSTKWVISGTGLT
jgi:hypothetical protein